MLPLNPMAAEERHMEHTQDWVDHPQGWVAGWGTLALINAGLAQGKNRSGLNWFLASLLLGPIATLALVAFCEKLDGRAD